MAYAKALGLDELRNREEAVVAGASECAVVTDGEECSGSQRGLGGLSSGPWEPRMDLKSERTCLGALQPPSCGHSVAKRATFSHLEGNSALNTI